MFNRIIVLNFDLKWLLLPIVIVYLCASNAASRGESGLVEQEACYEKFADIGLSEREVSEVSDLQVLDVCGALPRYTVNEVWHINRDRPTGVAEKAGELLACEEALGSQYPGVQLNEASDEQLIRACGTVPAILD